MSADTQPGSAQIDLDAGWQLDPQVALRPESFGGLAYNFGTRRLSMIRSPALLSLVMSLAEHPSARAAYLAARIDAERRPQYEHALSALAAAGVISRRDVR
ncbi:MAG: mycofactocin biosynthesis chaperone MftB [Solirubrobacteraceae bacterium]|jgi:putative mycofactocin binding protein MftB